MTPDSSCQKLVAYRYRELSFYFALAAVLSVCLILCGCAGVSAGKSVISPPAAPIVAITPVAVSLPSGGQQQFAATVTGASNTAVSWTASQGTITQAGWFTAPSVSSVSTVSVTATSAAVAGVYAVVDVTVTPLPTLAIAVVTLANATEGVSYLQTLSASGGVQPYSWNTVSGSMPAGIQLGVSSGAVSGTTGDSGPFAFTVQVMDSSSPQEAASVSLAMSVQPSGIQRLTPAFFGMHINRHNGTYPMPTIPFGAYRSIDSYGTLWNGI